MAACSPGSGPAHERRQGHQDRIGIAARPETEHRAAVVEQIELHIAAAADQLPAALLLAPALVEVAADDCGIDAEEGLADVPGEGEVGAPVAAVEVVEENAAGAARFLAVL